MMLGIIRFLLVMILVFMILRFLSRLVAEIRSYLSKGPSPGEDERRKEKPRRDLRDIRDAHFEDLQDSDTDDKPQS